MVMDASVLEGVTLKVEVGLGINVVVLGNGGEG